MMRFDELYLSEAYQAEKNQLTKINNNGMTAGIAMGIGSFVFLRAGPKMLSRYLINKSRKSGNMPPGSGGYQFDIAAKGKSQKQRMMQPPPNVDGRKPSFLFRTLKLGLDIFVSVSLATWGSLIFTDAKKLMDDLSDIPLVQGRSLISEELCDDFIDVYKAIPKKTWDKYDEKSVPLDAITNFVKNCLRRQIVEKEILDQKRAFGSFGIDANEKYVEIPSPGVPRDLDVEIPFTDKSEELDVEKSVLFEDDAFQSSEFDFDTWNDDNKNDKE